MADWTRARADDDGGILDQLAAEEIDKKVLESGDSKFLCDCMLRFGGEGYG